MNQQDPTTINAGAEAFADQELTVEEVAQLQADEIGNAAIPLKVPTRKLKGSVEVDPAATPHVGARIQAGKIESSKSREMFRYM